MLFVVQSEAAGPTPGPLARVVFLGSVVANQNAWCWRPNPWPDWWAAASATNLELPLARFFGKTKTVLARLLEKLPTYARPPAGDPSQAPSPPDDAVGEVAGIDAPSA